MSFNPNKIKQLNATLSDVPGLEMLWFTALENAPWFDDMDEAELVAAYTNVTDVVQYIVQQGIAGEYLLRVGDDVPWVRVILGERAQWVPVLLAKTKHVALVHPNLTLRQDVIFEQAQYQIFRYEYSPIEDFD